MCRHCRNLQSHVICLKWTGAVRLVATPKSSSDLKACQVCGLRRTFNLLVYNIIKGHFSDSCPIKWFIQVHETKLHHFPRCTINAQEQIMMSISQWRLFSVLFLFFLNDEGWKKNDNGDKMRCQRTSCLTADENPCTGRETWHTEVSHSAASSSHHKKIHHKGRMLDVHLRFLTLIEHTRHLTSVFIKGYTDKLKMYD